MLIYFASDDIRLRRIAQIKLREFGRVVWGLKDDEVGHMIPSWGPDENMKEIDKIGEYEIDILVYYTYVLVYLI